MVMALEEQKLVFAINGVRFELDGYDPSTTLLEFLRTQTKFRGAKLGCGEGQLFSLFCSCSLFHSM